MTPPAKDNNGQEAPEEGPRKFTFPSHQSHMLSLAKMCQENSDYTDCVIQCGDFSSDDSEEDHERNRLRAHRLVLGSASGFLKNVFRDIPQTLPEATILVPGVKRNVCQALLDFLYTGEMKVYREDTSDLQLLIETLQIDPELISVDVINRSKHVEISEAADAGNNASPKETEKEKEKSPEPNPDTRTGDERSESTNKSESNVGEFKPDDRTEIKGEIDKTEDKNITSHIHHSRKRKLSEEDASETTNVNAISKDASTAKSSKHNEETS